MNRVSETYGISSYGPTMCNESPKEEEEEKEVESIFEEIMAQTSQNPLKNDLYIQEVKQIPKRINRNRPTDASQ